MVGQRVIICELMDQRVVIDELAGRIVNVSRLKGVDIKDVVEFNKGELVRLGILFLSLLVPIPFVH